MNIVITANREISFKKKSGEVGTEMQTVRVETIDTRTKTTLEIMKSNDPLQAFIQFMEEASGDCSTEMFVKEIEDLQDRGFKIVVEAVYQTV